MNQYGLKNSGNSDIIDQLTYGYHSNSNKLIKVTGNAPSDSQDQLGDFQDGSNLALEYTYDGNGNMSSDANKKISLIGYNYLNLPDVIRISGKGSIYYSYAASGSKLRKRVVDSTTLPAKVTTTLYVGNAVYTKDTLQFFSTGEGRARPDANRQRWV
jgi:hypothetical protein